MSTYHVLGVTDSPSFYAVLDALNKIQIESSDSSQEVKTIESLASLEAKYKTDIQNLALKYKGGFVSHLDSVVVYKDDGYYIGGLAEFIVYAKDQLGYTSAIAPAFFNSRATSAMNAELKRHNGRFVFMDIEIGKTSKERIIMELDENICPLTTANFISLCNGDQSQLLHYMGCSIHRVVPDGYIQGGDIVTGSGEDGKSIYGDVFRDECFDIKFDQAGIIAMCRREGQHTNSSQFMITVEPLPWMNKQAVAFGKVIKGIDFIKEISKLPTMNERPIDDVMIVNCGEVDLSEKK